MEDSRVEENTDKAYAINHIKHGVITALIIWGIDLGKLIVGVLSEGKFGDAEYTDPWSWIIGVMILGLIWGMTRKSRTAALLMLLLYVAGVGMQLMILPSLLGIFIGLVIIFFLAKAVYGCFEFHRAEKALNPNHKPSKWWMLALGVPIVLFLGALISLYYMSLWGVIPATHVKSYQEISDKERDFFSEWSIVNDSETLDMFYSFGVLSYKAGGTLLTSERLITFVEDESGELVLTSLKLDEIADVTNDAPGDEWEEAVYYAWPKDETQSGVYIVLSTENSGDEIFMQKLYAVVFPPEKGPEMPEPTMGDF